MDLNAQHQNDTKGEQKIYSNLKYSWRTPQNDSVNYDYLIQF